MHELVEGALIPKRILPALRLAFGVCCILFLVLTLVPMEFPLRETIRDVAQIGFGAGLLALSADRVWCFRALLRDGKYENRKQRELGQVRPDVWGLWPDDQLMLGLIVTAIVGSTGVVWVYLGILGLT